MKENLILCGFPRSGKTTVGRELALKWERPFIDTDLLVEKEYLSKTGSSLNCFEIYKKEGEAFFRTLETRVIAALKAEKAVIAVGGGACLSSENVAALKRLGLLVYLKVEKELLKERILNGKEAAFLDQSALSTSFESLYSTREPLFLAHADTIVDSETIGSLLL